MKRRAFKLLLFLLAGAIVNVAAAWGCHIRLAWLSDYDKHVDVPSSRTQELLAHLPTGLILETSSRDQALGFTVDRIWGDWPSESRAVVHGIKTISAYGVTELQTGWPLQSLHWRRARLNHTSTIHGALLVGDWSLPVNPLWPGFAINTIFYAAIVWALFTVPGIIRRRVRRKRGQCAVCGYSLRGTTGTVCPECGATA